MWLVDSALRDKVGSLWLAASIDARVLSPCSPLHNPTLLKKPAAATPCTASLVFSSQILESSGVRIQNAFSVIASRLVGVAIHKQKVDSMAHQRCAG